MNIILSLIYAPLVFLSLRYFDIQKVSIILFLLSSIWFFLTIRKSKKEALYPLLYIMISIIAYILDDFLILKAMPIIISITITTILLISYINKKSIILYFAKKLSKKEICKNEQEYIQKSTLFWIIISSINIILHSYVFINENINFWIYYSSIGWYFIFAFAGVLQFLHRKFIFLKVLND